MSLPAIKSPRPRPNQSIVRIFNVRYESIGQAALALGVTVTTVTRRLESPILEFAEYVYLFKAGKGYPCKPRKVVIDGKEYCSVYTAARVLRMPRSSVRYYCKRQLTVEGRHFAFKHLPLPK
jgi:hypothetical protein